jgi:hypothetical protein
VSRSAIVLECAARDLGALDVRIALPECGIFSAALNAVRHFEGVAGRRPWTMLVLVPTDQALACLTTVTVDELPHSSLSLTELARAHPGAGRV